MGKISETEYKTKINQLGSGESVKTEAKVVKLKTTSEEGGKLNFCSNVALLSLKKR